MKEELSEALAALDDNDEKKGGPARAQDAAWPRAMKGLHYNPRNLLTSLVLVFPLFLSLPDRRPVHAAGAERGGLPTVFLFHNLGLSTGAYSPTRSRSPIAFRGRGRAAAAQAEVQPAPRRAGADRERHLRADDGLADRVRDDPRAARVAPSGGRRESRRRASGRAS
jgi:hypothetical protein